MPLVVVRRHAKADVLEAKRWYDDEGRGLGDAFVADMDAGLDRIRTMPFQFPEIGAGVRRALLRRFPYAVYFLVPDADRVVVLAVLHQKRDPAMWRRRRDQ